MNDLDSFIEVEYVSRLEHGSSVAGELCMSRRSQNRTILVVADGGHTGVKANITASIISSMALNYTSANQPLIITAQAIINTFGGGFAAFAIVNITIDGRVQIIEYQTPRFIFLRGDKATELSFRTLTFTSDSGIDHRASITEFKVQLEDRIILTTSGIPNSGIGTARLTDKGFRREGIITLAKQTIQENPTISAFQLATLITARAEMNDLFMLKNDMSSAVIYFRQPRKMLLCSGPPFNEKNDKLLATKIDQWPGTKVISGGTTASILGRELGREITVNLRRDISGLPPTSTMDGVDLITEGVLTLARVKQILEEAQGSEIEGKGTDFNLARMLLAHDVIEFIVGTRVNSVHQDPNLPVELELRRNVIKEIARQLKTKFRKEVRIEYL